MTDSERTRIKVVHGWAFRNHSEDIKNYIRQYLATGDPEILPDMYKRVREAVLSS